jgi:hypothetical protein
MENILNYKHGYIYLIYVFIWYIGNMFIHYNIIIIIFNIIYFQNDIIIFAELYIYIQLFDLYFNSLSKSFLFNLYPQCCNVYRIDGLILLSLYLPSLFIINVINHFLNLPFGPAILFHLLIYLSSSGHLLP